MGIDASMKAKLAKFNKNFSKEKKRADELGGFAEIPDGKYLAKVTSCEIKNSNAGEMHLVFIFEITESAEDESLVGAKASKWCNVEREDGPAYLIRDLRKFGIDLDDLEQLPEVAKLIDDQKPEVKISLKTGNSGQFTYLDTVISEIDAGDKAMSDDNESDDDEDEDSEEEDEESEEEGEDEEEQEEDDLELKVGVSVQFTSKKGEKVLGEITVVDEKKGTVDVKSGKTSFKGIAVDRLSIPEAEDQSDESEEEEEEDESKSSKVTKVTSTKGKAVAKATKKAPAKKTAKKK